MLYSGLPNRGVTEDEAPADSVEMWSPLPAVESHHRFSAEIWPASCEYAISRQVGAIEEVSRRGDNLGSTSCPARNVTVKRYYGDLMGRSAEHLISAHSHQEPTLDQPREAKSVWIHLMVIHTRDDKVHAW